MQTLRAISVLVSLILISALAHGQTPVSQLYIETRDLAFDGVIGVSEIQDANEAGDVLIFSRSSDQTVLLLRDLRIVPLQCPGNLSTSAEGINARGTIVGTCTTPSGTAEGFLRTATGQYQRLRAPGALNTYALGISDQPEIVAGFFTTAAGQVRGFLWQGGAWRIVDPPNKEELLVLTGVNSKKQIVGFTWTPDEGVVGVWGTATHLEPFHAPGAFETGPLDITDRGEVVGTYLGGDISTPESFYFDGVDAFYRIRVPLPHVTQTLVAGLTQNGRLVGTYVTDGDVSGDSLGHGLLMRRFLQGGAATRLPLDSAALASRAAPQAAASLRVSAETIAPAPGSLLCPDASRAYQVPLKLQQVATAVCPRR